MICKNGFKKFLYFYFFGNQGRKALVSFLYFLNSLFLLYFFSSIGIPEIFKIKIVIVVGDIIYRKSKKLKFTETKKIFIKL